MPHPLQRAEALARDSMGAILARHGRNMQDWSDPAERKAFLKAYGREQVTGRGRACCSTTVSAAAIPSMQCVVTEKAATKRRAITPALNANSFKTRLTRRYPSCRRLAACQVTCQEGT
jgi:hypothetical protein